MPNVLALDFQNLPTSQSSLETLRNSLVSGGVIAFPTDTFYGLGVDPFNAPAVEKLFRLKHRPPAHPILVLIHNESQLELFTEAINDCARKLIRQFWPGPLTIIFKARATVPDVLTAGTGTIGVRLPGSAFTRQLLQGIGHPLTATSANLSGGDNPSTLGDIPEALASQLDYLVDAGPAKETAPSTIVDPETSPPKILREGVISKEAIESLFS